MTSHLLGGGAPKGDITLKAIKAKVVTRGRGGVKNLKMEVTSFMNAP